MPSYKFKLKIIKEDYGNIANFRKETGLPLSFHTGKSFCDRESIYFIDDKYILNTSEEFKKNFEKHTIVKENHRKEKNLTCENILTPQKINKIKKTLNDNCIIFKFDNNTCEKTKEKIDIKYSDILKLDLQKEVINLVFPKKKYNIMMEDK
jgi:hypothetical protein